MGIRVFRPYEIDLRFLRTQIDDFKISSFDVPHNGTECRGFLIEIFGQKVLYITDAEYCKYVFNDVDTIMIECNYDARIIDDSLPNYNHSCLGHMELQTCIGFINACCKNKIPKNVVLIHMSNTNLIKETAYEEIVNHIPSGINTVFATPGLEMEV